MAKRVFFSFHYQDVIDFRANVVRNHWITKPDRYSAGFFDASIWEDAKRTSDLSLKRLINKGLENTSNTCVLIGSETYNRKWVSYEIMQSFKRGNEVFGVHINSIKCKNGNCKTKGLNPFNYLGYSFSSDGKYLNLHDLIEGKWIKYRDLEGWAVKEVPVVNRNQIFKLSNLYNVYCWKDDNGYDNFSNWVK